MSSAENTSGKTTSSSLIESIVPMQLIANLENDRKNKINIPHKTRIKKGLIIHSDDVKLDSSGKCINNKSNNSVPQKKLDLHYNVLNNKLTCAQCNVPIIQTKSGQIKPWDIQKVTSHGDSEKISTFYRKSNFYNKTIGRESGDAAMGSFKSLNINRWLKSNWSKLTKDRWKNNDIDTLKKFTEGSLKEIRPAENDVVCNATRELLGSQFPFVINPIGMPMAEMEEQATPGDSDKDINERCCGDGCIYCKLACRVFGCKCRYQEPRKKIPRQRVSKYPEQSVSLNVLERAHLQNLYDTPCSSIQFSVCNCALEDALVKKHTTAAHYFAHKGLRQVDACGHHGRSVCGSSSCARSEVTEYRSQKSYVAYSVKSAMREDYTEDDDCCCKCCDLAMVSIHCQTDSRLHLGHIVQTEPQKKKCRPCCKCCRCNRKGGRCSTSCKHFQTDTSGAPRTLEQTNQQLQSSKPGSARGAGLDHKGNPLCCNKCTGIPNRVRGGHASVEDVAYTNTRQMMGDYELKVTKGGFRGRNEDGLKHERSAWCCRKCDGIPDRARGGAHSMEGSCVSCKNRLNAGTNNFLFGPVVSGNEERYNIGNEDSWLTRQNIARLLGMNKKKSVKGYKGFRTRQDVCQTCKFDLRRTPYIAKKFNQKMNKRQLNKLLALKNMQMQQQLLHQQQQQQQQFNSRQDFNGYNNNPDVNYDFLSNRNCLFNPPIDQHQHIHDLLAGNQQYGRNFEIINQSVVPSSQNQLLLYPRQKKHQHKKHARHNHAHAHHHHHQQRTLIYKTHSTQCMTKTHDQGTSCLADFKQARELGYELNVLPPFKADKYRKLFNEVSGKFKSPITGKEYNLKLEKVNYKSGVLNSDLPMLLEIDDKLEKLPKIDRLSISLLEYKENNDKIMNAICDAILLAKDIGAAGEIGFDSNNSTETSSNASSSNVNFKLNDPLSGFFNEPLIYRTKTIIDYAKLFKQENNDNSKSNNEMIDLFIQSKPDNSNKSIIKNSSGNPLTNSTICRSKNRSNTISTSSLVFSKIKDYTNMSSVEFKSFIMNNDMFQRKSSRAINQFKMYQLNDEIKNPDITSVENALKNVEVAESMPQCNVPNFIQENLSCFSNTISDTYSLLKILEHNQEKLSNQSCDEQIEKIINYSNFINDNS